MNINYERKGYTETFFTVYNKLDGDGELEISISNGSGYEFTYLTLEDVLRLRRQLDTIIKENPYKVVD